MERLLKATELARLTGLARTSIYRMAADGELPCVRFGVKAVRFPESAIAAWIAGRTAAAPRGSAAASDADSQ